MKPWSMRKRDDLILDALVAVIVLIAAICVDNRITDRQEQLSVELASAAEVQENTRFIRQVAVISHSFEKPFSGFNLRGASLGALDLRCENPPKNVTTAAEAAEVERNDDNLFVGCTDLYRADMRDADLFKANLSGASLLEADLSGANMTLSRLWRTDLREAVLSEADMLYAKMWKAELTGADLTGADLLGADLTGAYLSIADLTGARLVGTDLTGALLDSADLSGADLTSAILTDRISVTYVTTTLQSGPMNMSRQDLSASKS